MGMTLGRPGLDHLIDRPVLCSELDKAFRSNLTLVVAQAGAGKSTLLRQWAATHPEHAFAFLDMEASDDNPAHFIQRLVAALAAFDPAMVQVSRLINLHDAGLGTQVIAALATALKTMHDVVIVVDDAQRLSNVHIVADLADLVEQTPHNVHLVVSSRSDPPIALSGYRLKDEVLELRQADLAFTDAEAAELLERITGRPFAAANVHALRERTEGWVAGLQLAGLNLRHENDPDGFIAEFGGSDRLVADYLGEEVLSVLPAQRRRMLLQMSALEDMCAGLVNSVTGCDDAQQVLEQLQRDSMFLVQLDTHREWFRFHHMFRDLLRSRLHAEYSIEEGDILSTAAEWHLARGRAKSAVEYLLRAQLWDRALDAILSNAGDVVAHGDLLTVVRWMVRIPEAVRSDRVGEELLSGMLQSVDDGDGGRVSGSAPALSVGGHAVSSSTLSQGVGVFAEQLLLTAHPGVAAGSTWQEYSESPAPSVTGTTSGRVASAPAQHTASRFQEALAASGRAFFLAGQMDQARELLTRSVSDGAGNSPERVSGLSTLSLLEAWCGNVERANMLICNALLSAREAGMLSHPAIFDAYLASVLTALGRGAAGQSGDKARQALPSQARGSTVLFDRAVATLAMGGTESARGILNSWEDLVPEPEPLSIVQRHILLAWMAGNDNRRGEATRQLTEAVRLAEIHGLMDVFARAGPIILDWLRDVVGPQSMFRDIILAHAQEAAGSHGASIVFDALTDRELEILAYLPTRFTNEELATRFFVSINTIKTHMVHIYRKLAATNRDEAISRARVLGLL